MYHEPYVDAPSEWSYPTLMLMPLPMLTLNLTLVTYSLCLCTWFFIRLSSLCLCATFYHSQGMCPCASFTQYETVKAFEWNNKNNKCLVFCARDGDESFAASLSLEFASCASAANQTIQCLWKRIMRCRCLDTTFAQQPIYVASGCVSGVCLRFAEALSSAFFCASLSVWAWVKTTTISMVLYIFDVSGNSLGKMIKISYSNNGKINTIKWGNSVTVHISMYVVKLLQNIWALFTKPVWVCGILYIICVLTR